MGANVQSVEQKIYTDASEVFHEGMTVEDAQKAKSIFTLFKDPVKEFYRIDTDDDGILSKSEITSEIESDIKEYRSGTKWMCGLGIANALLGIAKNKTATPKNKWISLGLTLWCLYEAYNFKNKAEKLDQRLFQGCN